MATQSTPTVTNEDVARIVRRDFPAEKVPTALAILDEYAPEGWHGEPHRVRLAALKLAAGSIERLRIAIKTAKCDYRDVLAPAEYPGYSKSNFHIRAASQDERQRIIDADLSQYQAWLAK